MPPAECLTRRYAVRMHGAVRMMAALFALSVNIAAAQSTDAQIDPNDIETAIRLKDTRLEFRGLITTEAAVAAIQLYRSARTKPDVFVIESQGGSADAAIMLGHWLRETALDVEVDTFCFSSCANYLFTAGRHKLLSPNASLMWHGGARQRITLADLNQVLDHALADMSAEKRELTERKPRDVLLEQLQTSLAELIERETDFFQEIGVDRRITTLGHDYRRQLLRGEGYYVGWDYSLDDLQRLGVGNVAVKGQVEWQPVCPLPGQAIYRIRLDALPGFVPRLPQPAE